MEKVRKDFFVYSSYAYNALGIARLTTESKLKAPSEIFGVADGKTYRNAYISKKKKVLNLSSFIEILPYNAPKKETPPLHKKNYNIIFTDKHINLMKQSNLLFP